MAYSAAQGFQKALGQADPLPLPPELNGCGFKIRRGQLVMVAGISGAGKSTFVQWLLSRMNVSVLYGSADMDPWDSTVNVAAMMTGHDKNVIEKAMQEGHDGFYMETLADSKLRFFYDSTPSLDDVSEELDAHVELWDEWPDVVVVDNLVNVEDSGEYAGKMHILSELHSLAHSTGITVFVLHHALESQQKDVTMPSSKRDIDSKVTHYPELIVTVALDQVSEMFRAACVKQRGGFADATGKTFVTLAADPARCQYRRPQEQAVTDYWRNLE